MKLALCLLLLLSACAHKPTHESEDEELGALIETGPVLDSTSIEQQSLGENGEVTSETAAVAEAAPVKSDLHCLVIGPGMAKAFAAVGVLEYLQEKQIKYPCIIGVEMGAVIGALYADKQSTNAIKWQLYKLKREIYLETGFLSFGKGRASGKKLHQFFAQVFGKCTAKDLGTKFVGLYMDPASPTPTMRDDLPLADVLSASVAVPGIFEPWQIGEGSDYISAAAVSALPIEVAQGLGASEILIIDPLDDEFALNGQSGLEESILKEYIGIRKLAHFQSEGLTSVIRPHTQNFNLWDFHRQLELFEHGREAAKTYFEAH